MCQARSKRVKNLFEAATVAEVKGRITHLKPDSERVWGTMNPAQALAHCSAAMEMAMGAKNPPRIFIGRLLASSPVRSLIKEVGVSLWHSVRKSQYETQRHIHASKSIAAP